MRPACHDSWTINPTALSVPREPTGRLRRALNSAVFSPIRPADGPIIKERRPSSELRPELARHPPATRPSGRYGGLGSRAVQVTAFGAPLGRRPAPVPGTDVRAPGTQREGPDPGATHHSAVVLLRSFSEAVEIFTSNIKPAPSTRSIIHRRRRVFGRRRWLGAGVAF